LTIAVEPEEQMLLTAAKGGEKRGPQGPHKIQGMGAVSSFFSFIFVFCVVWMFVCQLAKTNVFFHYSRPTTRLSISTNLVVVMHHYHHHPPTHRPPTK